MLEGFVILGSLGAFEFLAARYGKTSRDGEDWTNRSGPHLTVGR